MIEDCKPYRIASQKETHSKMDALQVNESFLAFNYKSLFNYLSVKSMVSRIRLDLHPKQFVCFRTHDGYRVFRSF